MRKVDEILQKRAVHALCALVIALTVCQLSGKALASQAMGVLVTNGSAEISVVPDIATVVVGVSILSDTAAEAQAQVAKDMEAIGDALIELGLPEEAMQTRNFRVGPEYDYHDGKQVLRGYRATHDLHVKITDVERLGVVLDAVVSAGASQVREIQFGTSRHAELLRQALSEAVKDARSKAEAMAAGAGVTALRVSRIHDQSGYQAPIRKEAMLESRAMFDGASTTQIAPGEVAVRASVEVEFVF